MEQTTHTNQAIKASGLGKQYGSFWALKNCDIALPKGSVSALVGPNGAGKTTLLKLLASLNKPSSGQVAVLGSSPEQTAAYLSTVGYLAQDVPLYKHVSAAGHFAIGAHMDTQWDNDLAVSRLNELNIPLNKPVGKLSGGQRAQVGLAMALAKKPKVLLLDEPVAALDPLARIEFLTSLTQAVTDAEGELTIIMSSHLLADLERICDHVIILASGQTQLCDDIDQVLQTHMLLVGPRTKDTANHAYTIIKESHAASQTHLLVRLNDPKFHSPQWHMQEVDIEEIVLAYMGQSKQLPVAGGAR
jgi:ABC-2 type transport system ATP-binding protein